MPVSSRSAVVLVRAGGRICAVAIEQVIETMRPLAIAPLSGTPAFVRGAAVIRGRPVPVVDLAAFLGSPPGAEATRLVLVRCGARAAALAVEAVLGVATLDRSAMASVPLLDGGAGGAVEALGALDRDLLVLLQSARIVPEDTWHAMSPGESPP